MFSLHTELIWSVSTARSNCSNSWQYSLMLLGIGTRTPAIYDNKFFPSINKVRPRNSRERFKGSLYRKKSESIWIIRSPNATKCGQLEKKSAALYISSHSSRAAAA